MATATESGFGGNIPSHRNELVNREALRGQMVKEASYLTGMDTVYAQLEEQARQFDESLELKESQFSRKLEYEYDALERQSEYWDAQIHLGWGQIESNERTARMGYDIQQEQMDFARETRDMEMEFAQEKMDVMSNLTEQIYSRPVTNAQGTTTKPSVDPTGGAVSPDQKTMQSGWIDIGGAQPVYSSGRLTPEQFDIAAR